MWKQIFHAQSWMSCLESSFTCIYNWVHDILLLGDVVFWLCALLKKFNILSIEPEQNQMHIHRSHFPLNEVVTFNKEQVHAAFFVALFFLVKTQCAAHVCLNSVLNKQMFAPYSCFEWRGRESFCETQSPAKRTSHDKKPGNQKLYVASG